MTRRLRMKVKILLLFILALSIDGQSSAFYGAMGSTSQSPCSGSSQLLYDQSALDEWSARYPVSTRRIFDEGFRPVLYPDELQTLINVDFQFPLTAEGNSFGQVLAYYSYSDPPRVVMPILSLKFLDDLSIAYAWLTINGYSVETVTDYVAMLKYNRPENLVGGRYPTPLEALQIPDDALEDQAVDELALRIFNSGRAFILAHELGHIYHKHPGNRDVSIAQSQQQEEDADQFALDLLGRASSIPIGAYLFFLISTHCNDNRFDFQSDAEWEQYVENSTHPLDARRMRTLANYLFENAEDFIKHEPNPTAALATIEMIATDMQTVVSRYLEDLEIQQSIAIKGRATDVEFLGPRYPGQLPCEPSQASGQQPLMAFDGLYTGDYVRYVAGSGSERLPICVLFVRRRERAIGRFSFGLGEGSLEGDILGDELIFNWEWGGTNGKGKVGTTDGGITFSGTWGYDQSADNGGGWHGHR